MLYGCACGCGRCIHLYAATKARVGLDLVTFLVPVESEAQNPLRMVPTSTSNRNNGFDYLHMLCMGKYIHHHAAT